MKRFFVITVIIIELSIVAKIVSPWLNPQMLISERISYTATYTLFGSVLSYLWYILYQDIKTKH